MDIKNVLINLRDDLMKWTTNNMKALQATIPSADDFATQEYVDEKLEDISSGNCKVAYGTCSTEAATAEKTVVVEDMNWKLEVGSIVTIRFTASNSASNVTINVNGTGAYPIWASSSEYTGSSTNYTGYANRTPMYMFNGTHWVWISNGVYPSSTTNASIGHGYGVCSTAEATLAKACTISNYTLAAGGSVSIKFTNAVSANSTLNIRTRGAKKIFYKGVAITDGVIKAGDTATFVYDGTQYQLISIDSPSSTKKGTEVFFISGDTEASTQGHWVGQHPDITELYEGLVIAYQIPIAGGTSNTYIKINDFEEKTIYFNRASAMKEQYLPGSTIFLVYTNYNDRLTFRVADYDSNTNTRNTIGDYQSTDTKLYLAGSKTIDTSDDDSYATSFVNPNVYIGTDNALYSENKKVATEVYTSSLLDIDYDSLLAFDTTEIIRRLNYVDRDNSIVLDNSLPDGTYTLKYEFKDGTYTDIKNFIIENEPKEVKINLNFISQNTALKGVKNIGLYDSNGNKLKNIPLGNLAPKSTGNILYRFGALSDVHLPYNTGKEDFIRALNYFNNTEKVDFICISGDMSESGTAAEWTDYKTHVDTYSPNTAVHISAGNHDAMPGLTYEYPRQYTGNPLYYSFEQGNDVFIMFGLPGWDASYFTTESLQWLYEILEENRNKRCFVFQHIMRKNYSGDAAGIYGWDGLNNTKGKVFLSLMEHYKNVLWFHGHSHCEFEHQETMSKENANYDRLFGCHSIHIPSCAATRNENNTYEYEDSEGYVVDVYDNGVHLRGRDFIAEKFLPIASYWIDTTLRTITANSYTDSTGTIKTESNTPSEPSEPSEPSDGITLPENAEFYLNKRYSGSSSAIQNDGTGMFALIIPVDSSSDYILEIENSVLAFDSTTKHTLYLLDSSRTKISNVNSSDNIKGMTSGKTLSNNGHNVSININTTSTTKFIALSIGVNETGATITADEIKNIIITLEKVSNDEITLPEGSELILDKRFSGSSNSITTIGKGGMFSVFIPIEDANGISEFILKMENLPIPITKTWNSSLGLDNHTIYLLNENKVDSKTVNGNSNIIANMNNGLTDNGTSAEIKFIPAEDRKYVALTIRVNETGAAITEDDIGNIIITLEKVSEITLPKNSELVINQRYSNSGGGLTSSEAKGMYAVFIPIENNTDYILNIKNNLRSLNIQGTHSLYLLDANKSNGVTVNGSNIIGSMTSGVTFSNNNLDAEIKFTSGSQSYVVISIEYSDKGVLITEDDIKDVIITLKKADIPENSIVNIPGILYNQRCSQSSGGIVSADATGMFTIILPVEPGTEYCLSFEGLPLPLNQAVSGTSNHALYGLKSYEPIEKIHIFYGTGVIKDFGSATTANSVTFTTSRSTPTNYIVVSIAVTNGGTISANDVEHITYKLEKI